jgi:hypothetical protein
MTPFCRWDRSFAISLCFKGQRDLLLRNDFNRQRLGTTRIATPSQQLAKKRPQQTFR